MKNQHPAIVRAAALQSRFWAHAPQPELCSFVQTEIELLDAQESDRDYRLQLETEAAELHATIAECGSELDNAEINLRAHEIDELWSRQSEASHELEQVALILESMGPATVASFTVKTEAHPSWNGRKPATIRNFATRAEAQAYADYFGRSTITESLIVPCAECGGHGSDGPVRVHWTNPNNMAMRCGRCNGTGEEPISEEYDEDDYPNVDPYRD